MTLLAPIAMTEKTARKHDPRRYVVYTCARCGRESAVYAGAPTLPKDWRMVGGKPYCRLHYNAARVKAGP